MLKITNTAIAAALAIAIAMPASLQTAEAGSKGKYLAIGAAIGILGTAAVARNKRKRAVRRASATSAWNRHVLACHRAYKSYEEASDTWIDRKGRVRRCNK